MTVFWKLLLYLFEYLINLLLFELNVVVLYVSDSTLFHSTLVHSTLDNLCNLR